VYPVEPEHDLTHVAVVAEDTHSLDVIQRMFPSGQVATKFFYVGTPYAIAYRVKAGTRAQTPLEEKVVFDDRIVLVSLQLPGGTAHAGETLPVTISWTSRIELNVNYTIFVHLAPSLDSPPIAQEDAEPCDNSYPTTWWSPGEIIEENRRIVIPAGTAPGQYVLTTGVYELATGKRLPMFATFEPPGDQFVLGVVNIAR